MTFGKYLTQWSIATVVFAVFAFISNTFFAAHRLWPFGIGFLYIGVLILVTGKLFIDSGMKKD